MVFKPDPIQARVSGFDRVTGSARSIPIFKKIQNGVVLVKKTNVNGLQPGFLPDQPGRRIISDHSLFYFFINPI
jgi:hypothetical protein